MSDRGIVYVTFGRNYNYQAAFSARSVRKLCALPICVFTNVPMEPEWGSIEGVTVVNVAGENKENRDIKTALHTHSPFDKTLYLDTDTLVCHDRFLHGFDMLDRCDMAIVKWHREYGAFSDIKEPIYRQAHETLGYRFPLILPSGGVFFFRKSDASAKLFDLWHYAWDILGRGRDMPALAWAWQQDSGLKVEYLHDRWNSQRLREGTIIAHAWGGEVVEGIPKIAKYIPSIHDNATWRKVSYGGIDLEP